MTQLMGPAYNPSSDATNFASKYHLGIPRSEYKATVAVTGCWSVICLIVGIFVFIAGMNTSSSGNGDGSGAMIVGGVIVALGVLLLIVSMSRSGDRVFLYNEGFVYLKGGQATPVWWDDVTAIYQRIVEHRGRTGRYTTYTYTIQQRDGTRFVFDDNFNNMPELCKDIETAVGVRLLPKAIIAYEMGEKVSFGDLGVSKNGISNGRELLRWDDVSGIRISGGYISVKKTGKWLNWSSFHTPRIPNLTVCQLLIDHIASERASHTF